MKLQCMVGLILKLPCYCLNYPQNLFDLSVSVRFFFLGGGGGEEKNLGCRSQNHISFSV